MTRHTLVEAILLYVTLILGCVFPISTILLVTAMAMILAIAQHEKTSLVMLTGGLAGAAFRACICFTSALFSTITGYSTAAVTWLIHATSYIVLYHPMLSLIGISIVGSAGLMARSSALRSLPSCSATDISPEYYIYEAKTNTFHFQDVAM